MGHGKTTQEGTTGSGQQLGSSPGGVDAPNNDSWSGVVAAVAVHWFWYRALLQTRGHALLPMPPVGAGLSLLALSS